MADKKASPASAATDTSAEQNITAEIITPMPEAIKPEVPEVVREALLEKYEALYTTMKPQYRSLRITLMQ